MKKNKSSLKKQIITLTDKQEKARRIMMEENHYTSILFDGGSRAGKSYVIIITIILLCYYHQGLRVLIARLRFAHARASLWEQTLLPILNKMNVPCNIDRSMFIIRIGKSEIWLGGLDDKERTEKVLGQEYGLIFLNEAVEIPMSSRDIVLTRLAQNIEGFINFIIYDCNPRQPTHYLYREFYIEKDEKKGKLKFLPEDNKEYLPKGYIENILEKLPEDKKKRFLKGEWSYLPGAVYGNIKDENKIECNKNLFSYDDVTIGIDWGLYMACTVWGVKRTSNKIQMYCIHQIIILNGTTADLINELNRIVGIKEECHILYCDHEPDRILELESFGYMAKSAYKEVGAGDSSVNECELFFDNRCENTFQSMVNLTNISNPSGQGFLYGKHIKENDHECLIGDTLILTDKGEVKIKDIKIGDMVLTRQGYKRVYNKWITGIKDVYEYEINKNKIICTNNHKFYIGSNKYKEAKYLTQNDIVCILGLKEKILCQVLNKLLRELNLMEYPLEDIQNQKIEQIESILDHLQKIGKKELDICILKYGKKKKEIFRKIMLFIIRMGILLIMKYQIWNVLKKQNIVEGIAKKGIKIIKNLIKYILRKQEKQLRNGIKAKKEENGIKNMLRKWVLDKRLMIKNVKYVKKIIRGNLGKDSVQISVNPNIEEKWGLITKKENVNGVENYLPSINIVKQDSVIKNVQQIINGKYKGKQKIYSISVEDAHEYFANNILVANSDSARYAIHGWIMDNRIKLGGHYLLGKVM